jgi:hypothetical protein
MSQVKPKQDFFDEFKKDDESKEATTTTSVVILKTQKDFVDQKAINLSKLMRKFLAKLMRGEKVDLD